MKYFRRYPAVRAGMHTSDEVLYRAEAWKPCTACGERTDWVDVALAVSVCSEECRYAHITKKGATPGGGVRATPWRAGRLVIVRRDRREVLDRLTRRYAGIATVMEDRRTGERRRPPGAEWQGLAERRRQERRRSLGPDELRTWSESGYFLVAPASAPPVRS